MIKIILLIALLIGGLIGIVGLTAYDRETDSLKPTKKTAFGSIVLIIIVGLFASITKVPANTVGIKYNAFSGTQNKPMNEGFAFAIPGFDKVTLIDTTVQERTIEGIKIQAADGERLTFHINVKYSVNRQNAFIVYQRHGSLENLHINIIKNDAENALREVISPMTADAILTEGGVAIRDEASALLATSFAEEGVNFEGLTIEKIDADDAYYNRLLEKKAAQNEVEKAELRKTQIQIEADAKLIEAQGQADANAVMQTELTPQVLQKMFLDKWNGELPKVHGGANGVLDYSEYIE